MCSSPARLTNVHGRIRIRHVTLCAPLASEDAGAHGHARARRARLAAGRGRGQRPERPSPGLTIVGLADRACQEAKERVRSGIASAELEWPDVRRITVNLAPAGLRKEGSGFDLPIALAVLAASHQLPRDALARSCAAFGELALDGRSEARGRSARRRRGSAARRHPAAASAPPSRAPRSRSRGSSRSRVHHLAEAVAYLRGDARAARAAAAPRRRRLAADAPDLAEVRGQALARYAVDIVAGAATTSSSPARRARARPCSLAPGILPLLR